MAVEFRQNGEVVAAAIAAVGMAVGARVPTGPIDVYVNGELLGSVLTPDPGTLDKDGQIQGGSFLSGSGCPAGTSTRLTHRTCQHLNTPYLPFTDGRVGVGVVLV